MEGQSKILDTCYFVLNWQEGNKARNPDAELQGFLYLEGLLKKGEEKREELANTKSKEKKNNNWYYKALFVTICFLES